jgi:hypothetical protein
VRPHLGSFDGARLARHRAGAARRVEAKGMAGMAQDWASIAAVLALCFVAGWTLCGWLLPELPAAKTPASSAVIVMEHRDAH